MAVLCVAADHGGLIKKKERKRKFMGKTLIKALTSGDLMKHGASISAKTDTPCSAICGLSVTVVRAGLTIPGPIPSKAGALFSYAKPGFSYLWRCTFFPKKVDNLFLVVVMFKRTLNVQTSKQRGKNLAADRRGPPCDEGGPPMVQPTQWIIRSWLSSYDPIVWSFYLDIDPTTLIYQLDLNIPKM